MSLSIQNNLLAMQAHQAVNKSAGDLSKSMQKLSTGYRINSAADDAAGLSISEKMRGQIRGLAQAQRNIQDGQSLAQTAEGSLDEVHQMLQRVRELAVQFKNGSVSTANQGAIQSEVNQLASEIERIGTSSAFNGIKLLDGTGGAVTFQVGANDGETISLATMSLGAVIGSAAFSLSAGSNTDLAEIDAAIDAVSSARADFGAAQNRLDHTLTVTATAQQNLTAAESRIRDVDMAEEMTKLTKNQILQQAGTAMLAQANQAPNSVLSLLRG